MHDRAYSSLLEWRDWLQQRIEATRDLDWGAREELKQFLEEEPAIRAFGQFSRQILAAMRQELTAINGDAGQVNELMRIFRTYFNLLLMAFYDLQSDSIKEIIGEADRREALIIRAVQHALAHRRQCIILLQREGEVEFARRVAGEFEAQFGDDISHIHFMADPNHQPFCHLIFTE